MDNMNTATATTEPTLAQVLRQAMADWNAATPAQRDEALALAAAKARR